MTDDLIPRSGVKNHLGLFTPEGDVKIEKTLAVAGLTLEQAHDIFRVRTSRKKGEVPEKLKARLKELAGFLDFVSETLGGNAQRTRFWFHTPNANFGGLSPIDLMKVRRYQVVYRFILEAKKQS